MEFIWQAVENFVGQLPPLLQLLLGAFVSLGVMKVAILIADYVEEKRPEKN